MLGLQPRPRAVGISQGAVCLRRLAASEAFLRFPEPLAELECGPIWRRSQMEEYARRAPGTAPPTRGRGQLVAANLNYTVGTNDRGRSSRGGPTFAATFRQYVRVRGRRQLGRSEAG